MRKKIKVKFLNGLEFGSFKKEVLDLYGLDNFFEFIEADTPEFIIFGPYGNDVPPAGKYTRIGYFCENITPDLSNCEWAFGIPPEKEINNPRYKRIQWHGLNPEVLLKDITDEEALAIYEQKTHFCNFFYSNPISYREEFFKQLSAYKHVDAPGKSMNNMPAVETLYSGSKWEVKRQFLSSYKFTIAFESYSYPGYQTEKLYDAMQMNSIPIYCGDPEINLLFNQKSFINAFDYINIKNRTITEFLERNCQYDFKDYRPCTYNSLLFKIRRKLKSYGKIQKMKFQLDELDFEPLIKRILELDSDKEQYLAMLREPWFNNNTIPLTSYSDDRWKEIFNSR